MCQFFIGKLLLELIKNALVFLVQKVPDFFHYSDCIGFFLWVLTQLHQSSKKFLVVGHIEIARHDQVAASPIVLLQKWMAGFNAILSVRSVAQVSQPNLPREGHVFFEPFPIRKCFLAA